MLGEQTVLLCRIEFETVNIYCGLVTSQALLGTARVCPQVYLAGIRGLDPDSSSIRQGGYVNKGLREQIPRVF